MFTFAHWKHLYKTGSGFALTLCVAISATPARAEVSQAPLLLGGGNVPGNLVLVPSVEWPTILSVANLGNYSTATTYTGYFDSGKCYNYSHNAGNPAESHFYPVSLTANRTCTNAWSGNYLNWAATQTIDPFRSALTGGYRVKDTTTETWLEKANHTGQNSTGNLRIPASSGDLNMVRGATPADWDSFSTRVAGLKNRMFFAKSVTTTISDSTVAYVNGDTNRTTTVWSGTPATTATTTRITVNNAQTTTRTQVTQCTNCVHQLPSNFAGATPYTQGADLDDDTVYEVYIRVKVCDATVGLEANCKRYGSNYKPEGLIQQYSQDIRYSVFGYLNDSTITRDGGVLRAQQKYVGPNMRAVGSPASLSNPAKEWDESTGVFIRNPNPTDATASSVQDSGVINYLNKFGQMTTQNHKSYDPVSELYYTALRYLKNQGNISAYSTRSDDTNTRYNEADGFPVITNWTDPIQYACQKNVLLGIGDVNTHRDKNLPGNTVTTDEPTAPQEVTADTTINVETATQKVAELEGITINTEFTGRQNSAYIAGLAYDANTKDQRPLMSGRQTFSTHWVDVRENGVLAGRDRNQYWLAAKYGGFKVPTNFGDPYTRTAPLEEAWWRTTTDWLDSGNTYKRPDNFYVASDATKMVESLKKAFVNISNEVQSTTASLATNSTRLGTDTAIFQSLLDSRRWSGDLLAKRVAANGVVASTASWSAADKLDAIAADQLSTRKIFTNTPPTQAVADGPFISTTGRDFTWSGLNTAQRALLRKAGEADDTLAQSRLNFLRGDRTNEISVDDQTKPFRQRSSRMGDIVNSDPQLIHKQDFGYARLSWSDGDVGDAYTTFRQSSAYQARKPLIVVGANDGMLHGFDASISDDPSLNGGKELFAYVPDSVISNLTALTEPNYSHRYYVDGTPRVSDVWLGASTGWKTMVVGSTGAGGKSIFALDITDPSNMTNSKVMWEFRHPKMGYTLGQPALVALPSGEFGVIVSSGYHDTDPTDGRIWILNASNGSIIAEYTLATTGGLGGPLAADTDYDLVADRVYVGDTLGNLWRLDLSTRNGNLQIANPLNRDTPLFIAKDAAGNRQAITAPLSSAFNDDRKHMLYFGTGSFYKTGDNEVPAAPAIPKTDTFYGIIDEGTLIDGRSSLLQQQILREVDLSGGRKARAITQNAITSSQKGWYIDLVWSIANGGTGPKGERVVARATLRNDRVIFTTLTPAADPCAFGGSSFIMSVSRSSGARLNYGYFDTDGDGDIDNADMLSIDGGNMPASGISNPDDGVTKGVASLYKWLCFAGSSGAAPTCIPVSGSHTDGRKSWREVRSN